MINGISRDSNQDGGTDSSFSNSRSSDSDQAGDFSTGNPTTNGNFSTGYFSSSPEEAMENFLANSNSPFGNTGNPVGQNDQMPGDDGCGAGQQVSGVEQDDSQAMPDPSSMQTSMFA